jgi:hypothetical protein
MFDKDNQNRVTRRFGGIEFVPANTLVRSYGESGRHVSSAVENGTRYNDFVPVVYGTAWYQPLIVFAKNDGNLTRMEVLLGIGEIQAIHKVIVNGIEIPLAENGRDMTATGWFNVVSKGNRTGGFNLDHAVNGQPLGDPYGSMAYLSVVVPNRISDGRALPKIEALIDGLRVSEFDASGSYTGEAFSNNPAFVLLDMLRRTGWELDELDLSSFGRAAQACAASLQTTDLNGVPVNIARYQCNLALRQRQSAAEVIRGVRNGSSLLLGYDVEGRLQLRVEGPIGQQQPVKPEGSNAIAPLAGGWPAYEFGDGSDGPAAILRREDGQPAIRVFSRSNAESPNRAGLEFQDAFNEFQQDSVSLIDAEDVAASGQEIAVNIPVAGVPNPDQALRAARLYLNKSIAGNIYVEFETSMKSLGVRPGDLIAVTYLREGFSRQPFRVAKIAPKDNYRTAIVTAQIHDEAWYEDGVVNHGGRRRGTAELRVPRPIGGVLLDEYGLPAYRISENTPAETDGGAGVVLDVEFRPPAAAAAGRAAVPLLALSPTVYATGGTLPGGRILYYALTGVDANGVESDLSFTVRAAIPSGSETNRAVLTGLSFNAATTAFHVYRGRNPQQLERIAASVPVSASFTDTGLAGALIPPPDSNYDHANFYWRTELVPAVSATVWSAYSVGNPVLNMIANEHRGAVVYIASGKGAGQERSIISNDATTVALSEPWIVTPDSSSRFSIAEAGWRFGSMSRTDRATFQVPNRRNVVVHVLGRSANARDEECPTGLCVLTRWLVAGGALDGDVPDEPVFGLTPLGDGSLELSGIGFPSLENTRTIAGGTLTLHYWDELSSPSSAVLATGMPFVAESLQLAAAGPAQPGDLVQIGSEVLRVDSVLDAGLTYEVTRGSHGTAPGIHPAGSKIYHLSVRSFVIPFVREFFGSPASGSFSTTVYLPNARVAAADLVVKNVIGDSPAAKVNFTATVDDGIRTLSGGQLQFQVDGYLAIQSAATPPVTPNGTRAIRDVFAMVRESPAGASIVVRLIAEGQVYCELTIPAGATISEPVSGFDKAPIGEMSPLTLDIVAVPPSGAGTPGRDLTVTIRY